MEDAIAKRKYLRTLFGKQYGQWCINGHTDDRKLFCNIYDILLEALAVMEGIDNNLIWVGFNHKFQEECTMLRDIQVRFE